MPGRFRFAAAAFRATATVFRHNSPREDRPVLEYNSLQEDKPYDTSQDAYMFVFEVFVAAFFAGLVGVACCAYCYRKIERETREACLATEVG